MGLMSVTTWDTPSEIMSAIRFIEKMQSMFTLLPGITEAYLVIHMDVVAVSTYNALS